MSHDDTRPVRRAAHHDAKMMHTALEQRVIAFVAAQTGVAPVRVGLDTTLFGDIGIDGDDAWDFMEVFHQEFQVDVRRFNHSRHFGGEGCFPPVAVYMWLRGLAVGPHEARGIEPIKVRDLVDAATRGDLSK